MSRRKRLTAGPSLRTTRATPAAAPLENGVVAEAQAVDEAAAQAAPQQSEDMAALDALFNEPEGEEGEEGGGYLHEKDVPF